MKARTASSFWGGLFCAVSLAACNAGAPPSTVDEVSTIAAIEECGFGLYCSLSPVTGGSACLNNSTTVYCCPLGQILDGGTCVTQTCSTVGDLASCNAAGCAWYSCAEACRPQGTDICTVCPGYPGCGSTCDSIGDLASCNAAGCAWYSCAEACRAQGTDICTVCPGYPGCGSTCDSIGDLASCNAAGCAWYSCANACRANGTGICEVCAENPGCSSGCEIHDGDPGACSADPACVAFPCSDQCWPQGTTSDVACGCLAPRAGMVITSDTTLCPGTYALDVPAGQAALTIAASDVTVTCNQTVIESVAPVGPTENPNVGIRIQGQQNVKVIGCGVHHFRYGVVAQNASRVTLDGIDADDNFTDPRAGWVQDGVQGGGIRLDHVTTGSVVNSQVSRNWNGVELRDSSGISVTGNVVSSCSNWGVLVLASNNNSIAGNDVSFAIRGDGLQYPACKGCPLPNPTGGWYGIDTRDSAGILLDAGSTENQVTGNDVRYGGDGIFVRGLERNYLCAPNNYFANNDTSYSPHNAIESWCDYNQFVNNVASFSNYGIWLGATDHGLARGNTVDGNKIDGISIQNGSDRHSVIQDNTVTHSGRAGIFLTGRNSQDPGNPDAYGGTLRANSSQILVQNNTVSGSGIADVYVSWSRLVTLASNCLEQTLRTGQDTLLTPSFGSCGAGGGTPPAPALTVPANLRASVRYTLDASGSTSGSGRALRYSWLVQADWDKVDDPATPPQPLLAVTRGAARQRVTFPAAGTYEVMLTVDDGSVAAQKTVTVTVR